MPACLFYLHPCQDKNKKINCILQEREMKTCSEIKVFALRDRLWASDSSVLKALSNSGKHANANANVVDINGNETTIREVYNRQLRERDYECKSMKEIERDDDDVPHHFFQ